MWNLKRKKWLKSTYLLSKNRATGVETENYGYKGGTGGVNWETGADIHTVHAFPSCLTLHSPMDCSPPGSSTRDFPGKNTGVACHFLLQWVFPTKGSDQCLLHRPRWQVHHLPLVSAGKPICTLHV